LRLSSQANFFRFRNGAWGANRAQILQKWDEKAARLYPRMEITGAGLVLGAGTIIAKASQGERCPARLTVNDEPRVMALLASSRVEPLIVVKVRRACELWNEGEKALAYIHLAHIDLPPCDEKRAFRRFAADGLLESGVTPKTLLKAQGVEFALLALLKCSPDQPRVPAGNGCEGGRWTAEDTAGPAGSDAAGSEGDGTEPHTSGQQLSFAGTLIDKRYDEVLNITHCTYSTPLGTYTLEFPGFYHCEQTTPVPPWLF
jgi:hypothetical protein